MFVCGDETHLRIKDAQRKYGWAQRGEPAFYRQSNPSKGDVSGFSFICFFTIEGMKVARGYDVTVKGNNFLSTLESDVLPWMNPFPQKYSILLLDNAAVHQKQEIIDICRPYGVRVMFLPPYSYEFNPIELAFHSAKALLRKRKLDTIYGAMQPGSLFKTFEECLMEACDTDQACNMFQHCHIPVTEGQRKWARL